MKVLIVTIDNYPHNGGKSTHISNLIDGLKYNGVECEVFARNEINEHLFNMLKVLIQPLKLKSFKHYLYWRRKCEIFLYNMKLRKKLQNNYFDIVSAQDAVSCTLVGRVSPNMPISLTMHTYYGLEYTLDNNYFNLKDKFYRKLLSFELESFRYTNAIVAVDKRIKEHVLSTLKSNSNICKRNPIINTISNFTNTDVFSPRKESNSDSVNDKNNFINNNDFVVICVRRLVEKNGVYFAIQAMNYIPSKLNIKLIIVGDGPEKNNLERTIEKSNLNGKVKLFGAINNGVMPRLYSKCSVALVPSITVNGLQEATSISAIEAMACGIPTIASNIGGLSQLITNNETGFLVPEKNEKAIAEVIMNLYSNKDLKLRIGMNSRNYIINKHSHIIASKEYLNTFIVAKEFKNI